MKLLKFKDFSYFCHPFKQWRRGRAARLGSAKAPTPVRIRTMPLKPSKQFEGFFLCLVLARNEAISLL
ncbi:hypothetical protein ASE40_03480 [Flavobacterium sp. Root935]|nr:hypothetical protein ASE40_03480 [Flavobacterium sp. Root935]